MNSTNRGAGIRIRMDSSSGVPFYRQVIQQIEQAILTGMLEPGDRLPTIRSLAIDLKINPNTIAKAYNELEIRGIVTTQVGSGTFVSDRRPDSAESERKKRLEELVGRFVAEMAAMGMDRKATLELVREFKED
ncbi:MAG: GntR family transcriptional regulator [Spirochaetes bacterium]|nr:GntR family transcriptional regulator [Spirochaetota bacterium]